MSELPFDESLLGRVFETKIHWQAADAVLLAIASGADPDQDLDYLWVDRDPKALPMLATILGGKFDTWGRPPGHDEPGLVDQFVAEGAELLLLSKSQEWFQPIPAEGTATMLSRLSTVWDKGSAAVVEMRSEVHLNDKPFSSATNLILYPGAGGFGGERGPSRYIGPSDFADETTFRVPSTASFLYQLLSERVDHNVDPKAAATIGLPAAIAPGVISQSATARALTQLYAGGDHNALRAFSSDFAAPHFPGEELTLRSTRSEGDDIAFEVRAGERQILTNGRARLF